MVYNGKPYKNGWFGGTTIFGNIHMCICILKSFKGKLLYHLYSLDFWKDRDQPLGISLGCFWLFYYQTKAMVPPKKKREVLINVENQHQGFRKQSKSLYTMAHLLERRGKELILLGEKGKFLHQTNHQKDDRNSHRKLFICSKTTQNVLMTLYRLIYWTSI